LGVIIFWTFQLPNKTSSNTLQKLYNNRYSQKPRTVSSYRAQNKFFLLKLNPTTITISIFATICLIESYKKVKNQKPLPNIFSLIIYLEGSRGTVSDSIFIIIYLSSPLVSYPICYQEDGSQETRLELDDMVS